MIDIFITAYLRPHFTKKTLDYLDARTKAPWRLFLIDNGGNEQFKWVEHKINLYPNMGIHAAWNVALVLATEKYFITTGKNIECKKANNIIKLLIELKQKE